jgi:YidC/Oxa1 family membrane protein insertase
MREDNKNLIVAIALSLAVLLGWQYFFAAPEAERQRQAALQQQQATQVNPAAPNPPSSPSQAGGASPTVPGTVPSTPSAPVIVSREAALANTKRVTIDTPAIAGSINLRGGRIDDVALKNYRETVDPRSANIVLLSPEGTQNPYYAEFGWVGAQAGSLPNAATEWTADRDRLTPSTPVTLSWDNGQGLVFRRTISVDDKFMFTIKSSVENRGSAPVALQPYGLVSRHGRPTTLGYYVLHEGMIGVLGENGLQEITYDTLDKEAPVAGSTVSEKKWDNVQGGFLGITDKYWATTVVPDQAQAYQGAFTSQQSQAGRTYHAIMQGAAQTIQPGSTAEATQRFFAGAKEVATVDAYQNALGIKNFDLVIDWGWFYFITKPLFKVLDFFYRLFGNFGIAILLVTVVLKILFFPLANKSYASMAKMKAVQPEMVSIRERYADDKMKQQQALMELYRKEKINPVAGCWPVLIQIPVFFALYKVLFVTIEMRHAPFFGWIRDLAAPDPTSIFNLFGLLPYNPGAVPVIGPFLMLGIWPIIMGITMWLQMKMNPEPPDPVQKQVFAWMPVIFTFMLGSFPAGLVIYWAWNNLLSVTQQAFIMKRNGVKIELWDNLRKTFSRRNATQS